VAIVTMDVIGLPRVVSDEVAAQVQKQHGLARSQLVLSASHTHSGPVIWPNLEVIFDTKPEQRAVAGQYARRLTEALVRVVGEAIADLKPARIAVGHTSATFAINRRQKTEKAVQIGVNPTGPVDRDVPVIRVTTPDGKPLAVVFAYACHNTTLGGDQYQINGDYAGFAQIELEKALPGTGADQNPSPRGKVEQAAAYGKQLADAVAKTASGDMRAVAPPIRTAWQLVDLPFAPHDRATFEAQAKSDNRYLRRRAEKMLKAYDEGHPVRQLAYPVQAVRLGDGMTLVALGGEVVVDYALRLKREMPDQNLMVAAYSNDVACYIPTVRVLREGGYEPVDSMIYYGQPGPLAESIEDTIVKTCRELVGEVSKP
jgi:hypothetical protein